MELTSWKPQLQDILARDSDRAMAIVTIPTIQAMWPRLQEVGDAADVCKAALVYSLSETTVEDENGVPRAKWEVTKIAIDPAQDDPDEELMPYSATWTEFCLVHLGMAKSTASKYKRIWQVYHEKLGYGLDDLLMAGVFKLGISVGILSKMIKRGEGINPRLITALFGSSTTCSACNGYVPFTGDAPSICPLCDEDYQGVQPWSGSRTLLLVQQLRGKREEEGPISLDVFASLEHSFDDNGAVAGFSVLVECVVGETKSSLPPWEINVLDDDNENDLGIKRSQLPLLTAWLRRKFPGI